MVVEANLTFPDLNRLHVTIKCSFRRTDGRTHFWMQTEDGNRPRCPERCNYYKEVDKETLLGSYVVVQQEDCMERMDQDWSETAIAELSPEALMAVMAWSNAAVSESEAPTLELDGAAVDKLVEGLYSGSAGCACVGLQICGPCSKTSSRFTYATAYSGTFPDGEHPWYTGVTKIIPDISSRGEPWMMCPCAAERLEFLQATVWSGSLNFL
jgi:hypothetical protein